MTEIYLIRHTQAEGNLYHMMQGHWDGDITALGAKQIDALAERFRDVPIDALYSSDLSRTRMTAGAITKYHELPMRLDTRLREMNVGNWEGVFFADAMRADPTIFHDFIIEPEKFKRETAETYFELRDRMVAAVNDIAEAHPDQCVAVVSHGLALRALIWGLTGRSLSDQTQIPLFGNTGVAHLYHDNGVYTVDYLNDVSHLPPELNPTGRVPELLSVSFDPKAVAEFYRACYEDAWKSAHGDLVGYNPQTYFDSACAHYQADHGALLRFFDGENCVGLLDMDTERGRHANYGWISLLYLKEEYRHRGCAPQLLGRAVAHYRGLGRTALRLLVSEDNTDALRFYERMGFRALSYENGSHGRLHLMEKKI